MCSGRRGQMLHEHDQLPGQQLMLTLCVQAKCCTAQLMLTCSACDHADVACMKLNIAVQWDDVSQTCIESSTTVINVAVNSIQDGNYTAHHGTCAVLQGNLSMTGHLADVCNSILLGGSVCVAFNYNTATKLAYFKAQPPNQGVDFGAACVYPNVTLWVLDVGKAEHVSQ